MSYVSYKRHTVQAQAEMWNGQSEHNDSTRGRATADNDNDSVCECVCVLGGLDLGHKLCAVNGGEANKMHAE